MKYTCVYDAAKDLQPVYPGLGVDVAKAIDTGVVPDTGVEAQYNDLTEAEQIGFRVSDQFQAMELQKSLSRRGNAPAKAEGEGV